MSRHNNQNARAKATSMVNKYAKRVDNISKIKPYPQTIAPQLDHKQESVSTVVAKRSNFP
jgi:hypothetical protein